MIAVGCGSLPPEETTTWPNRPSWKCSVTVRVWCIRTSIPSYGSRSVALARGSVTSMGATVPVWPHSSTPPVAGVICVWPWFSLAVPDTCTTSPSLTRLAPLSKTKMPSEVVASPSPASWT